MTDETEKRDQLRNALLGADKHKRMTLEEVQEAGRIFFNNPRQISLYGMNPAELYARGCEILGRTTIECTIDAHGHARAQAMKEVMDTHFATFMKRAVIDLHLGSGNLMYHMKNRINADLAIGFELDQNVFTVTRENFNRIGIEATLINRPLSDSDGARIPDDYLAVVLIDPPWGKGFSFERGLDLRRTEPPVPQIFEKVNSLFAHKAGVVLWVGSHELTDEESVAALASEYPLLARGVTRETCAGTNTGYLIFRG